ncbi:MAG: Asp-tRNA(Asn)/Glu-tRNA(Gln) amidotransferase subunit GatB [Rickettsiaceae bacterium]|nr:Asp-tRNA(Asn)/Glu-tRNA(Gln) amidotransferase subunit GatB [Rickettsiaceae bacterium]
MSIIKGSTGDWEYVIGLEIHAQVNSKSKLFSAAPAEYGASPNSNVALYDVSFPGMLPVLNKFCVEQAVRTGLAINGNISKKSVFDRKNYFYADLPQGYQISQFYHPIIRGGQIDIIDENNEPKKVRIHQIHLEQDAGKSMHDQSPIYSFIDLNRAGVGLMEIVSEPDMRSPYEAGEYIKKLRAILRTIGTCDGNMEQGSLRVDANVSVRKAGEKFGTRCEIKNVNSIKNVMRAIEYEAFRQVGIIERGGVISQETRLFDASTGTTRTMRSKEDAHDYRYFPDPDLLPLEITDEFIEEVKKSLPELPDEKLDRYISEFGLSFYDASLLSLDTDVSSYFEEALALSKDAKLTANWIISELFAYLNKENTEIVNSKISAVNLGTLIGLIKSGEISGKIAKQIFEIMSESGDDPEAIIKDHGLKQISNSDEILKIIELVLTENPESVERYKNGKDKLFGFFVGQVMKKTGGKANPSLVNELLHGALNRAYTNSIFK